ncbi:hypothetical protein [Phormidesmis priestleyi]
MGYPLETDRYVGMSAGKESIVREFSTFCIPQNCQGYRVPQWVIDRTLHRLLIHLVDNSLRATKDAWARYFLLTAQQYDRTVNLTVSGLPECQLDRWIDRLIKAAPEANQGMRGIHHQFVARQNEAVVVDFLRTPISSSDPQGVAAQQFLSAYLQPPCWYAARHFHSTKIAPSQLSYEYSLEDCFQIATEQTIQPVKLLQHFQLERRNITLRTYAEKTLERVLQRIIQLKTIQNDSTWKLLRYLSQKELTASLQAEGYSQLNITSYTLIWRCFKEIYQTKQIKQNQLPLPTKQQLQEMGDRYNQRRKPYEIIEPIAQETISTWLEAIARSVRVYRSSDAMLDRLLQDHQPSDGLADLMQLEQTTQVGTIVRQAFLGLPAIAQIALNLWFGLELTHAEILQLLKSQLGIEKQYQLSRQIKRYKKLLLTSILEQLNEHDFEIQVNVFDRLTEALDEYLVDYCKSYFYPFLQNHIQQLQSHEKLILYLHYQQHWEDKKIAEAFNLKSSIPSRVITLNLSFQSCLKNAIQTDLGIDLSHCDARLTNFVEIWLKESAILDMGDVNNVES